MSAETDKGFGGFCVFSGGGWRWWWWWWWLGRKGVARKRGLGVFMVSESMVSGRMRKRYPTW